MKLPSEKPTLVSSETCDCAKKSAGKANMNPTTSKMESVQEGSGTSGLSPPSTANQVTPKNSGQRTNATIRALQQKESKGFFFASKHDGCAAIGWSVVKTFMCAKSPKART